LEQRIKEIEEEGTAAATALSSSISSSSSEPKLALNHQYEIFKKIIKDSIDTEQTNIQYLQNILSGIN
jgi:hypothetical protein